MTFFEDLKSLLEKNNKVIIFILTGAILIGLGVIFVKDASILSPTKVEVLESTTESKNDIEITVEVSGAVENPGVYKLPSDGRVEDLLILSGGFSKDADRSWTDKYLNRAAKVVDGQKIYIPRVGEQTLGVSANKTGVDQSVSPQFSSNNTSLVNINTASLSEIDKLPGIGPVYGQNIIDHRPYSTIEEMVSKGAIKQNVFEKIKDMVSVY